MNVTIKLLGRVGPADPMVELSSATIDVACASVTHTPVFPPGVHHDEYEVRVTPERGMVEFSVGAFLDPASRPVPFVTESIPIRDANDMVVGYQPAMRPDVRYTRVAQSSKLGYPPVGGDFHRLDGMVLRSVGAPQ